MAASSVESHIRAENMSVITENRGHLPAAALIVGPSNSGKSTYLQNVVDRARSIERRVGGVISHGLWKDGAKSGFVLEAVATGEQRLFADSVARWQPLLALGRFHFSPEAIRWGITVLEESAAAELVVIDEFGLLELDGGGLWPGIEFLFRHSPAALLIAVRPSLVAAVKHRIHLFCADHRPAPLFQAGTTP
jgi:nucleoside-triphosphatase THEP1